MKKIYLAMLLVAFFLDYSFLPMLSPSFSLGGCFVVLALVAIQLKNGFLPAIGWMVLGGFLLDYVSLSPFGLHVLVLVLVGFLLDVVQNKLLSAKPRTLTLLACFFACLAFFDLARFGIMEVAHLAGLGQEPGSQIVGSDMFSWLVIKFSMSFAGILMINLIDKIEWLGGGKFVELKVEH